MPTHGCGGSSSELHIGWSRFVEFRDLGLLGRDEAPTAPNRKLLRYIHEKTANCGIALGARWSQHARVELDALMRTSLAVAEHRSLDDVLSTIVESLRGYDSVALVRIWLARPGDRCGSCRVRPDCPNQTRCLHLRASGGQDLSGATAWGDLDGASARVPIGVRKVGQIAQSARASYLAIEGESAWLTNPDWAKRERIAAFAGQPLRFRGEVLGVLAVFSRRPLSRDECGWLQLFADQAALAIAHAESFESVERLSKQLSLDNEALRQRIEAGVAWLAAGVSHEINSPLGALIAATETLGSALSRLHTADSPDQMSTRVRRVEGLANDIQHCAARIDGIVQKLAGFCQLERAERRAVSANEGLEAAIAHIEPALPAGVRIVRELSELPTIECQPRAMNQLYLSLLQNAVEAVGQTGRIVVRSARTPRHLVVEIQDDGPGISREVLPRVFELGFTTRQPHVGRGVGLALARHVLAQHAGEINIESDGSGTLVRIQIPLASS